MTKLRKGLSALLLSAFMTLGVGIGIGTKSVVEGRAEAQKVTYKITSKTTVSTTGTAPEGSTATYSQTYNNTAGQMTSGNSTTLTLTNYANCKITGLVLSMKSNNKAGSGKFSFTAGTTTLSEFKNATTFDKWFNNTSYGASYRDVNVTLSNSDYVVQSDEKLTITITGTTNSLYIQSYTLTYESTVAATKVQSVEFSDPSKVFYCGDTISKSDFVVKDNNGDTVTNYTIAPTSVPTAEGAFDITFTSETLGNYVFNATAAKKLTNISLKEGSTVKTTYFDGENFDPNNLIINTFYNSEETPTEITYVGNESRFAFEPSGALKTTDANVKIIYSDGYTSLSFDLPITVNENRLESLTIEGDMTKKTYGIDSNWDITGLTVKGTYTNGKVFDVTSNVTWTFDPTTANSLDITSVNVKASLDGVESSIKNITDIVVNNMKEELYDFSKIEGFENWSSTYSKHIITNEDVGATIGAKITFDSANKQSSTINDVPVMKSSTVRFELVDSKFIISSIQITLKQWKSETINIKLYSDSSKTNLILADQTSFTINYDNLNSASFAFENTNNRVGIASIKVILTNQTQLEFGTLDHIKVTTLPTKTEYVLNDAFDSSGLVVTAYDSADEETANKLLINSSDENLTILYSDGEQIAQAGNLEIDIEYEKNGIKKETSFTIYVYENRRYEKVIAPLSDWSGSYIIVDYNDQVLLNSSLDTLDSKDNTVEIQQNSNVIETSSIYEFTIAKKDTNYIIKSQKGYYIGASGNGSLNATNTTEELSNTIEFLNNSIVIKCSNAALSYNTSASRFRYYTNGSIQLYRIIDENAEAFAQLLLSDVTCDPTGATPPSTSEWETIKSCWNDLTDGEKLFVKESGANNNGSDIQKAVWKYDYIISKYGSDKYEDFMSRNPIRAIAYPNVLTQNSETTIAIIAIISLVSVSTIGGYFFIRKRKEQ